MRYLFYHVGFKIGFGWICLVSIFVLISGIAFGKPSAPISKDFEAISGFVLGSFRPLCDLGGFGSPKGVLFGSIFADIANFACQRTCAAGPF